MASLPRASIVLCTYQSERYLPELLASLRAQTVSPLEVIVQDDGSTDSTWALLEAETTRTDGLPLRPERNPQRLGFAQNFARALSRAQGEILFLCDHDDIWEPQKLEVLLRRFAADPSLTVAFSEGTFIGPSGLPLPGRVLAGNGLTPEAAQRWEAGGAFSFLIRRNPVPGMLMAFREGFRRELLPLPPAWEHDYWLLLIAAGFGRRIAIEPGSLLRYRQHPSQVIGGRQSLRARLRGAEKQSLEQRRAESERLEALRERLAAGGAAREVLELVAAKRDHLARRAQFAAPRIRRALDIALELLRGGYHRHEAGLSSALKDWISSP